MMLLYPLLCHTLLVAPRAGLDARRISPSSSGDDPISPVRSTRQFFSQWSIAWLAAGTIASAAAMPAAAVSGEIVPGYAEVLQLTLHPGEKVLADTGTLIYMTNDMVLSMEFRGLSWNRIVQGGRLVVDVYSNKGSRDSQVAIATQFPSRILAVQLEDYENAIIGNAHSFLAAPYNVELDYESMKSRY